MKEPMKLTTDVQETIEALKHGGVVVYPTETSYGIGCDAANEPAVIRVFEIISRAPGKGAAMLLSANERFGDSFATWDQHLYDLALKFWPGPLAAICPTKTESSGAPPCIPERPIATRPSSHPIASALADGLGVPLLFTVATISGEPEFQSAQEIFDRFSREGAQPDLIYDAGVLPKTRTVDAGGV